MPTEETPPASPMMNLGDRGEGDDVEEDAILDEDAIEVIEIPDDVADHEPEEEGGTDVGIVEDEEEMVTEENPPEDNSVADFSAHNLSVFCCDVHPSEPLAVTGGEDDRAYVWNLRTGDVVLRDDECFTDSVVNAAFSHEGTYMAAADMAGIIKVWKLASKEVVCEFETSDITWLSWHPSANVLFATTVDSELWMWKIPGGDVKVFSHGVRGRAEVACILADGRRVAVGYSDGAACIFDLRSGTVQHNLDPPHSTEAAAVTSMAAGTDLLAVGSVDGIATLVNTQTGKVVATFKVGEENSVESMVFVRSEQHNWLITGSLEGTVNIWDISTQVCRLSLPVDSGVVKMSLRNDCKNHLLLVATLEGLLRIVDIKSGKILADCSGHTKPLLDFAQSKDGSVVVTTSDDGHSKVFDLTKIL